MRTYDLYMFAAEGQVIQGWHKFDAADDHAAIAIATALVKHLPVELWRESVLVKRWEPAA